MKVKRLAVAAVALALTAAVPASLCPPGFGSWTGRRGHRRLYLSALEGAAGFAGRT
jgi:hypothetical protein